MKRNDKVIIWSFFILLWIIMAFFYLRVHPLVIWDTDDWGNISLVRKPYPDRSAWNPSKVFPEIFMKLCAWIGVKCIMPLSNDFIGALTLVFGLIVSFFIAMYGTCFVLFLYTKFNFEVYKASLVGIFFILFHFLIFDTSEGGNLYLLYSSSVTGYFHYVIPSLLNLILLMLLEIENLHKCNALKKGGIFLLIYLAIFSNLFCSYILMFWAVFKIFKKFFDNQKKLRNILYEEIDKFGIIVVWGISAIYELNGARADSLKNDNFIGNIVSAGKLFVIRFGKLNTFFVVLSIVIIVFGNICIFLNKEKVSFLLECLIFIMINAIYLVLLSAKTTAEYIDRPDVLIGCFFWILMFVMVNMVVIIQNTDKIILTIPIILFVLCFDIPCGYSTFAESNASGIDSSIVKEIDNDFIRQIISAVDGNKDRLELHIPETSGDNWPFVSEASNCFSHSLYTYGIINREIETVYVRDRSINEKYNFVY